MTPPVPADLQACGETRLLPGLADDTPVCLDCAGIPVDLRCTRCHHEDRFYRRGVCAGCCLSDDLAALLDDGSGRVHPGLVRFHAAVSGQPHPRSGIIWLRSPVVRGLLTDLASGRVPLTHAGIDEYAPRTATAHLRELLVQCGALPRRNRDLVAFETWLAAKLTQSTDPGQPGFEGDQVTIPAGKGAALDEEFAEVRGGGPWRVLVDARVGEWHSSGSQVGE